MGRLLQEFFEKISFFRHFQQCSAKFTPDSGITNRFGRGQVGLPGCFSAGSLLPRCCCHRQIPHFGEVVKYAS
jgi:hypothetical protein